VSASQTARTQRGWTLEVLNIVRQLCEVGTADPAVRAPGRREIPAALPPVTPHRGVPTNTFTTSDVYAFEQELEQLHPGNRNIKAKIRQQLQELRDQNLLLHIDRNFVSSVNFCREDFVPFVVLGGFLSGFIRGLKSPRPDVPPVPPGNSKSCAMPRWFIHPGRGPGQPPGVNNFSLTGRTVGV